MLTQPNWKINYKKVSEQLELVSKIFGVAIAAAIVLSTAVTNILFPLAILCNLLAGNWREKFRLIISNPIAQIFLLFYSLFVIGIFYSTAPWHDIIFVLHKYDKFLLAVFLLPLFTEERWCNYAINSFLAAIVIMLIGSYWQVCGWFPSVIRHGLVEVFKPSIEFNFLMAFAAYLGLLKIVNEQRYRWLWLIFLVFVCYTVGFRSMGRSGYIVFAGLVCLFAYQRLHWRRTLLAIISLLLFFGLAFQFSPIFKARTLEVHHDVKTYHQNENTSVGLRMLFVENSIRLIQQHPIFGAGTGSFVHEYTTNFSQLATNNLYILTRNPHNEYMYIMVQFGVLGLVVLLLVFGIPWWYSRFLPEQQRNIVQGVVLAIVLGCFANSWLLDTTEGHFYVYFIILMFASLALTPT